HLHWAALPSPSSLYRGDHSSARGWLSGLLGGKSPHKKRTYSLKKVKPYHEECESISHCENRRLTVPPLVPAFSYETTRDIGLAEHAAHRPCVSGACTHRHAPSVR